MAQNGGQFGAFSAGFGQSAAPAAGGFGAFGGGFGQQAAPTAGGFGAPAAFGAPGALGASTAVALPGLPPVINMVKVEELDAALTALQHEGKERLREFFLKDGADLHEIIIDPFLKGFEMRKAFEDGIPIPYLLIPKHSCSIPVQHACVVM